jgi:hypothetical protein
MGFLNISAWRSVGGRVLAERRATAAKAQPARYFYENLRDFQALVDRYFGAHGERPRDLAALYLWVLEEEGALDDDARAVDLADLFSYYDVEPHSLLGMVAVNQDHAERAQQLLEVRRLSRRTGRRPSEPIPVEAGLV